jgi:hypothetical protein
VNQPKHTRTRTHTHTHTHVLVTRIVGMADRLSAVEVVVDEAVMRAQAEDVEFMYHVEDVSRNVDGFYDVVKRCVRVCVQVCACVGGYVFVCGCVAKNKNTLFDRRKCSFLFFPLSFCFQTSGGAAVAVGVELVHRARTAR